MKLQSKTFLLAITIMELGILSFHSLVRAEDPLLGVIRAIKCVGCIPDKVTLVIHDPIEVRDFDITIPNSDYEKIVTPLAGKQVYDQGNGCFYWNEAPKTKKPEVKAPNADSIKAVAVADSIRNAEKKAPVKSKAALRAKMDALAAKKKAQQLADASANNQSGSGPESSAKNAEAPVQEMKPSRCVPYEKVTEVKGKN